MKTITFSNQKGGVAKTTSALIFASGLSKRGYRVLACDLDPQCNLSISAGADILHAEKTLYDVFKGTENLAQIIQHTPQGFDLIPGSLALASADMDFTQTGREYMLREALDPVRGSYDYCVADCGPSLGIMTVNALTASNEICIPVTADAYAVQGVAQLNLLIQRVKKYSNPNLKVAGLLVTKFDERTNASRAMLAEINKAAAQLNISVFENHIRSSVAVRESQILQSDLLTEAPKANAAIDYNAFIDEFLKKEQEVCNGE